MTNMHTRARRTLRALGTATIVASALALAVGVAGSGATGAYAAPIGHITDQLGLGPTGAFQVTVTGTGFNLAAHEMVRVTDPVTDDIWAATLVTAQAGGAFTVSVPVPAYGCPNEPVLTVAAYAAGPAFVLGRGVQIVYTQNSNVLTIPARSFWVC